MPIRVSSTGAIAALLVSLAFATPPASAEQPMVADGPVRSLDLGRHGWVSYRHCPVGVPCAAVGDPYRYNIVTSKSLADAAESGIQSFGFSLLDGHPPPFGACDAIDRNAKGPSFSRFWTDFVPLDPPLMRRLAVTWDSLKIVPDAYTVYRIRIVGCYFNELDGEDYIVTHPQDYRHEDFSSKYDTVIKLIMGVDIERRALKSDFSAVAVPTYPKAILDALSMAIQAAVRQVPVTTIEINPDGMIKG